MFGIGAQEILVLLVCCGFPFGITLVTLLVLATRKKQSPRSRDDDWAERGTDE